MINLTILLNTLKNLHYIINKISNLKCLQHKIKHNHTKETIKVHIEPEDISKTKIRVLVTIIREAKDMIEAIMIEEIIEATTKEVTRIISKEIHIIEMIIMFNHRDNQSKWKKNTILMKNQLKSQTMSNFLTNKESSFSKNNTNARQHILFSR